MPTATVTSTFGTLAKVSTATMQQARHSLTSFTKAEVQRTKAAEANAAVVANGSEAQKADFAN
ncbi:MAG: hypothetical protein JXR15_12695 [Shimia sp.]|uniref:hypothetical protein n=1 Tax=Shimia sp. TaxID=1954381 RepID=UPI003B8C6E78